MARLVQVGLEHVLTHILQRDIALEMFLGIQHREQVPCRIRHDMNQFAEGRVNADRTEIALDQVRCLQKRQHSLVTVMCQQVTGLGDSLGINRVFF